MLKRVGNRMNLVLKGVGRLQGRVFRFVDGEEGDWTCVEEVGIQLRCTGERLDTRRWLWVVWNLWSEIPDTFPGESETGKITESKVPKPGSGKKIWDRDINWELQEMGSTLRKRAKYTFIDAVDAIGAQTLC